MDEARRYNVLPLDDRRVERFDPDLAGRPVLIHGSSQLLFAGMGRLTENVMINIKNKSHAVTAQVEVPEGGATGVVFAQGGAFGGWSLYLHEGRPAYCYNLFGLRRFKVYGPDAVPAGAHQLRLEFAYDGGGLAKGGTASLWVDGAKVGEGRVDATQPMMFSGDETAGDLSSDPGSPESASSDYRDEPVHRRGQLGADRPRRGCRRRRPPDHARGTANRRDGAPVVLPASWVSAWGSLAQRRLAANHGAMASSVEGAAGRGRRRTPSGRCRTPCGA